MRFDIRQLLDMAPRAFTFAIDYTGLTAANDIFNAIGDQLADRIMNDKSRLTDETVRSFLRASALIEQAVVSLTAVETSLNSGDDPELLEIFKQASMSAANALDRRAKDRITDVKDELEALRAGLAGVDEEEDCTNCDETRCPAHPSHAEAPVAVASEDQDDEEVRFIDEKEDAETAGARRLSLGELPPQLQAIIGMLEKHGAQVHAFSVDKNSSH